MEANMDFKSRFSCEFEKFLSFKRALGFVYDSHQGLLYELDKLIASKFADHNLIDQEIVFAWIQPRASDEAPGTSNLRVSLIRELARFLKINKIDCYLLPKSFRFKDPKLPKCTVLDKNALLRLFAATSKIVTKSAFGSVTLLVIMKFMYCTGLRPSEVYSLKIGEADLDLGTIKIIETKGHNNREIATTKEISDILQDYLKQTSVGAQDLDSFVFTLDGDRTKPINSCVVRTLFHKVCEKAKFIPPYPRLYDFRHTFITHRILSWFKQGEDLNLKLPLLKIFVGHEHLKETLYYFKLIPELVSEYNLSTSALNEDLIPEVSYGI